MKYFFCLLFFAATAATAQITVQRGVKWDAQTTLLLQQTRDMRATTAPAKFIIALNGTDATATADSIRLLGGKANVIDDQTLTATLPPSLVRDVAALQSVRHISASHQVKLLNNRARQSSNVDAVHSGTDLETPFTGKGVIVGVLDAGFQWRHPAFLDDEGQPREIAIWNHVVDSVKPTTDIPYGVDDDEAAEGHGTHVAGIAAGSKHTGNPYYGMAPEADLVLASTNLSEENLLENAKWVKTIADEQGKPLVMNMSLGAEMGPHDGSTIYDQTLNAQLGAGCILVAAMGNSGEEKIHASATLSKGEEKTLLIALYDDIAMDFWGNATDGQTHFEVTPFYYDSSTETATDFATSDYAKLNIVGEINSNNQKEHYQIEVALKTLAKLIGSSSTDDVYFGLRVKALDDNASFHAWCESGTGEFVAEDGYGIKGDSEYLVGQEAASVPRAIAVASYNTAVMWTSASGEIVADGTETEVEAMSGFSSPGPSLGSDVKPTVSAPGNSLTSAFNKYPSGEELDLSGNEIICAVDSRTGTPIENYSQATLEDNDFYGMMAGTSMASPVVTGIVALWLQANPSLTPEDIVEIIRTTSKHDQYTGTDSEWNAKSGYGKIDAYEGLKAALRLSDPTAIDPELTYNSPVSISKTAEAWRILFNGAEERADISVSALNGSNVLRRSLSNVRPGDETSIDLTNLAPSVYILRVATPHATVVRKVVVGE